MAKKFALVSFPVLAAAFFFMPGVLTHGQDDEDDGAAKVVQGQHVTGYQKSEQGVTGGTDQSTGAGPGEAPPSQPGVSAIDPASLQSGTGIIFSDAGGVPPADFYMNLPAPTAKEAQAVLAGVLNGLSPADGQTKVIGLRLLNSAYTFLGIPYQHNGRGDCVRGIDCSKLTRCAAIKARLEPASFVALAGAQYGYALKGQYNMRMVSRGSPASLAGVQPGDFLFFNWRNAFSRARPYSIGHVALYIGPTKGGAMYLIEAGDPVQKRWGNRKYLVGVGRIVKAP